MSDTAVKNIQNPALGKRMLSVDVARGVAIVGMILVNATSGVHYSIPTPVLPFLLHASWDGFLLADFVFPAFLFIVGVSIALSLGRIKREGDRREAVRRAGWRALKLVLLGFFLSNIYSWYYALDWGDTRYLGVLQRIGIVYFAAAVIFLYATPRLQAIIAGAILILYTAVLYVPLPSGEAADLSVPGMNIACWLDRVVLGNHAYYDGELGYDPEGILSTLPGISQCLMGALTGIWLVAQEKKPAIAGKLCLAGAVLIGAGILLGFVHPIIKDLWSVTFVFLTSGITLAILSLAYLINDVGGRYGAVSHFFRVFGVNAIAIYTLHFVASFLIGSAPFVALYNLGLHILPVSIAALLPVIAFILLNWLAARWLWQHRLIVKI